MKSVIPNGWKKEKIASIGEVVSGATPKTVEPRYWDGALVWITPKDLSRLNSAYIDDSERRITDEGFKSCSAVQIPVDSLIMSSRAPIGYLAINRVPAATNQGCKSIVPNPSILTKYLYYYLSQNIDDVKRLGTGSTFAEVGKSAIESVEILVPPIGEQRMIAEVLSGVDGDIGSTEAIIEQAEKLKIGLTRLLFTRGIGHKTFRKTSFGEIPTEWLEFRLGELATITRGGSPRPIEDYVTDSSDGLNWLKIGDIEPGAKYITRTTQKIKTSGLSKTTLVKSGDFILSNSMSFGRPYIMKIDACIHDGWLAFKDIKANLIVVDYLYYLLSSEVLQDIFRSVAAGSGVKNLKKESVSNIFVALPPPEEQRKITEILSSIDEKISFNQKIKERLMTLKKGLMQDLLDGRVRTKV